MTLYFGPQVSASIETPASIIHQQHHGWWMLFMAFKVGGGMI
jgi:hypothetical protein